MGVVVSDRITCAKFQREIPGVTLRYVAVMMLRNEPVYLSLLETS